jgi:chemotaxis signal transduction protein
MVIGHLVDHINDVNNYNQNEIDPVILKDKVNKDRIIYGLDN